MRWGFRGAVPALYGFANFGGSEWWRDALLLIVPWPLHKSSAKTVSCECPCRQASNLKIADFLLRDFNQEEPRRSAAKNAFALLGQHRYAPQLSRLRQGP